MTARGDEDLANLIEREQRGFRGILYAGLVTLLIMGLMSAALGVYLYVVSQSLAETTQRLQRNAFDTRRSVAAQNSRIATQERAIRRAYDEIRRSGADAEVPPTPANIAMAREAASKYLLLGQAATLADQRALEQFGARDIPAIPRAERALFAGVSALIEYEVRGETIPTSGEALTPSLDRALMHFEIARGDAALAATANAGLARVRFEDASAERRSYSPELCARVFEAVDASVQQGQLSPQPLYWRAQCERKLGRTSEALGSYARALRESATAAASNGGRDETETTLAMNAFHGVGTTLISGANIPDDAPGMREALDIAAQACPSPEAGQGSARMALAVSCLHEAMRLRRLLGQSPNQVSGTGENVSFAYLRDGDFDAAYQNAANVEQTGVFAWNEVVRALSARHARFDRRAARRAAVADARRNVSMFGVAQFNVCELQQLMNPDVFAEALEIIAETHPDEANVGCAVRP